MTNKAMVNQILTDRAKSDDPKNRRVIDIISTVSEDGSRVTVDVISDDGYGFNENRHTVVTSYNPGVFNQHEMNLLLASSRSNNQYEVEKALLSMYKRSMVIL